MKGCRPLTDAEVSSVLVVLETSQNALRDRALFLLGVRSGFRISELLSLRIRDVLQNGNFVERIAVARGHMKGKKEGRTVILHPQAKEALELWTRELMAAGHTAPDTFIFRSREGGNRAIARGSAWHILKTACARAGLSGKLGTHCMRKTFAKNVHAKLGKDLMKTQKALGHRSITSTVSYLSFAEDEIDDAILKS